LTIDLLLDNRVSLVVSLSIEFLTHLIEEDGRNH
jgi:hypothetical protein